MRMDGRRPDGLRPVLIERGYIKHAEGSALISVGDTRVICTATVEDKVPPFLRGTAKGWITAEYAMLPRATEQRSQRESTRGKVGGRTMEIQRLIGRALRAVIDMKALGEKTLWIDCDVIQADGGTRTAAITGAFIAIVEALGAMRQRGVFAKLPVCDYLAATSVGIVHQEMLLDLCFSEDSAASVDMNVVMTGSGQLVEVQGTGETATFSRAELSSLLDFAELGVRQLVEMQRQVLGELGRDIGRTQ
ncbi:MAG: ribonuclease PH [Bacilli bacterium]